MLGGLVASRYLLGLSIAPRTTSMISTDQALEILGPHYTREEADYLINLCYTVARLALDDRFPIHEPPTPPSSLTVPRQKK